MQHATLMDAVSVDVKYVIDKIHGANADEEFHQAILDREVQIVLDESQWDRSTPIQEVQMSTSCKYITPETLNPLIMDTASCDMAATSRSS
eukprot:gene19694-21640_t